MTLNFEIQENKILLTGDTFALKEQIKQNGGRWNVQEKHWWLPHNEQNLDVLKTLGFTKNEIKSESPAVNSFEDKTFFKISEFVQIINAVIKSNLSNQYWIYGEISSFKTANGHVFFDLVEKDVSLGTSMKAASISCILWAGKKTFLQEKLNEIPFADGTQMKVKVAVDFRKEGSKIIAIVEDVDAEHTKGNLLLQRLSIVQELKKRNLYQKNKSSHLKAFPNRIALITAENSRACADFLDELKLSKISFQISLFDCNMQGENTSDNVVTAFKNIAENRTNKFDCVVVTRGGGSKLDLRWFDDLEIAKQIAYCGLPVITAVGHFDDVSIADEVSFRCEKTPTAAARFLTSTIHDSFVELFSRVDNMGRVLLHRFEKEHQALNIIEQKIILNVKRRFQTEYKNIERIEQFLKIFTSSIEKTMQRGFSLVYDDNDKILTGQDFAQENFPKELKINFSFEDGPQKKSVQVSATVHTVTIEDQHDRKILR
ncbi:MAG: exodeoxyribonuclease VII large subunit [Bdellovibrionota bacterium]